MLGEDDREILDFERGWWTQPGPKDQMIEFCLGLTAAVYYKRLLKLIDDPKAFAYDPLTVKRVASLIEDSTERELAIS